MKKIEIAGCVVKPGQRKRIDIKVAKLYDFTDMGIPVEVILGKKRGKLYLCPLQSTAMRSMGQRLLNAY